MAVSCKMKNKWENRTDLKFHLQIGGKIVWNFNSVNALIKLFSIVNTAEIHISIKWFKYCTCK